jgi:rare lipoprotein A
VNRHAAPSLTAVTACRVLAAPLGLAVAIGLTACFTIRQRPVTPGPVPPPVTPPPVTPPPVTPPPALDSVPDAIPRVEPLSRFGNPPFYDEFGKRYFVLPSGSGYVERGVASWYGPGFHEIRTSTGEPYDMYAMTAAHKTLPLPAYVRVTNLQNGRSVVVRVNDRGPFVDNRIIDLSYTAAAKLDMLRNGTAMVEVRTIDPSAPPPANTIRTAAASESAASADIAARGVAAPAPAAGAGAGAGEQDATSPAAVPAALFIQAGAFADPANAERLAQKLRGGGYGRVFVRDDRIAGRRLYRVRIGPVPDVAEFDRVVGALERIGIADAHLALD